MMLTSDISIGEAGVYALLGYAVVFFGLILLMCVVTAIGKYFSAKDSRMKAAASAAAKATAPAAISSTCTVFAESEVISQLANGVKRPDLVAGICRSVASRVAALARRAGVTERVCLSGGVAQNDAVRQALSDELNVPVSVDPLAQYFGAIGAALWAYKQQV